MVGLVPTIHPSACSGVRCTLDPRDKPEDDNACAGTRIIIPPILRARDLSWSGLSRPSIPQLAPAFVARLILETSPRMTMLVPGLASLSHRSFERGICHGRACPDHPSLSLLRRSLHA